MSLEFQKCKQTCIETKNKLDESNDYKDFYLLNCSTKCLVIQLQKSNDLINKHLSKCLNTTLKNAEKESIPRKKMDKLFERNCWKEARFSLNE